VHLSGFENYTTGARSLLALYAASGLRWDAVPPLAAFLYRFGTAPQTPRRARAWSDPEAVITALELDRFGDRPGLTADRAWWTYAGAAGTHETANPKLYVGVALDSVGEAVKRIIRLRAKAGSEPPAFKVGATSAGLHRPDRLVLYPDSPATAREWGARLAAALADLPPSPVPFTAALEPVGRVSWGADPPRIGRAWWEDGESWRGRVTTALAAGLITAQQAGEPEPWRFALERARLAGVNPSSWAPTNLGWEL